MQKQWEKEGLLVKYNYGATESSIEADLGSADIYKFAYLGHGAAGTLAANPTPGDKSDTAGYIAAGRYTKFHISLMELIACQTSQGAGDWKKKCFCSWNANNCERRHFNLQF